MLGSAINLECVRAINIGEISPGQPVLPRLVCDDYVGLQQTGKYSSALFLLWFWWD